MLLKKFSFLFCFTVIVICSSAQKTTTVDKGKTTDAQTIDRQTIERIPFSKNFNEFTIQQNFGLTRTKPENSDNHTTAVNLNIDYNRFIADHLALGVELDLSSLKDVVGTGFKEDRWMVYGDIMYGTTFNNNFNLYGKFSVGFGQDKINKSAITKSDLFGYKIEVGSPIHLYNNGGNYITPYIGYNYLRQKNADIKFTDNEFEIGFKFQNYGPCSAYSCDHGRSFSGNAYDRGRSFIGFSSMGNFGSGKSKVTFNNNTSQSDISGGSLGMEYGIYFIPDVAIGGGLKWNSQTQKSSGSKFTNSELLFTPMLTLNLPVQSSANNLFVQVGYSFGYQKSTSGTMDDKNNLSGYCINLGYNNFFGKHIAFTPKIGYDWETSKNTTTNLKIKQSALEIGLGGTLHF